MNNAFDPDDASSLSPRDNSFVSKRQKLLGPSYRLFYNRPLHVAKGKGTRLWDADGREYLDAYNNVVSVGHANDRVNDAIRLQMDELCTNTRYLQRSILDYAEDLLSTFDDDVRGTWHTMFTCTGSEANDLAARIAQHHTGARGVIVTEEAYHGNSFLTAGFSPSLGEASPLGKFVRTVPTPDSYRADPEQLVRAFTDAVSEQIDDLQRHGENLAAFVVDSLFTSDGVFSNPVELLSPVVELVHEAGGVFIADEVQSGFGRTGERFWGYQRHQVVPDIVTLGKPMGNGYPVAGIVVRSSLVERFGKDMRYFNTFGGNSVAIAAASATLQVINDERLQDNAFSVGQTIETGLRELANTHESIGDIRGSGLYFGVELVLDRDSRVPDATATSHVVNDLRERGVLISITGSSANVLKIRPPLVFTDDDASRLLMELDGSLGEIGKLVN